MEKIHEIDSLLCKPEFSSATKTSLCIKKIKSNQYSTGDWWECDKYHFKENAKILSKNSTTQENVKISRKNLLFY